MEEILSRLRIAVDLLEDGQSIRVGDLRLGVNELGKLYVTGWSRYSSAEYLTKQTALDELREIKALFFTMVEASLELAGFITGRDITFNLALDYGMGAFGICSEHDGVISWDTDLLA